MRAISSEFDSVTPTDSFLGVLDQFAALRSYSSATPDGAGYRVLSPKATRETTRTRRRRIATPELSAVAIAALARARLRLTGFLSVMFIGGLGLAVLAGPATCPSCTGTFSVADRAASERLGYIENTNFISTREHVARSEELPVLGAAALLEPEPSEARKSPITTSSLEPAREAIAASEAAPSAIAAGRLPVKITPVADAGPTIQLAAASNIESDVAPTLPLIEVTTPTKRVIAANDDDDDHAAKSRQHRKRAIRAYRTPVAKNIRPGRKNEQLVQRAPRWAQQMYVTPWQTQAFSYTR